MQERFKAAGQMTEQQLESLQLFSPERTLGYLALGYTAQHSRAVYELMATPMDIPQYDDIQREVRTSISFAKAELVTAREKLTMFDGPKEALLSQYLNGMAPPLVKHSLYYQSVLRDTQLTWNQWLGEHATDDEILLLLSEHQNVMVDHATNEDIEKQIQVLQDKFMFARDRQQKLGFFGRDLKDPSDVSIVYGDIFDTYLNEAAGYYTPSGQSIVLGQGHKTTRETYTQEARQELRRVLTHEWVHALVGKSREDFTSPLASRWINEAKTEMISRTIREASGEKVVEDNTYIDERQLLADILSPAKDPEVVDTIMTRAFSGSDSDRDSFVQVVDQLWHAKNVIEKVSDAIAFEEKRLAGSKTPDRAIEIAAIQKVRAAFKKDPHTILLRGVDEILESLPTAAQES